MASTAPDLGMTSADTLTAAYQGSWDQNTAPRVRPSLQSSPGNAMKLAGSGLLTLWARDDNRENVPASICAHRQGTISVRTSAGELAPMQGAATVPIWQVYRGWAAAIQSLRPLLKLHHA
jgi:hypothetical protein